MVFQCRRVPLGGTPSLPPSLLVCVVMLVAGVSHNGSSPSIYVRHERTRLEPDQEGVSCRGTYNKRYLHQHQFSRETSRYRTTESVKFCCKCEDLTSRTEISGGPKRLLIEFHPLQNVFQLKTFYCDRL